MSPPKRLVGVRAKIDRALEHIEELDSSAKTWIHNCAPPVFETEVDGEWEIVRLRVSEFPPARLPVIAGDVAHNLRSALDHLAWQLVDAITGKPSGDNYFPILLDKRDFETRVWKPRIDDKGRERGPLVPIPKDHDVLKIIESHQPYARWDPQQGAPVEADPLFFLNSMWNIDKHRILYATALGAPTTPKQVFDLFEWDADVTLIEQRMGPRVIGHALEDRVELARFRFAPLDRPKPYVRPKGPISTYVLVGYKKKSPGVSMRIGTRGWDRGIVRIEEVIADTKRFLI